MPSIEDYLRSLKRDRDNFVNNLQQKGITASITETFTSLVRKILDITTGTDTSKGTAVSSDIKKSKIAYSQDQEIIGDLTFDKFDPEYTRCLDKAKQIEGTVPLENPYFNEPTGNSMDVDFLIKTIPLLDTSKVTNMQGTFYSLTSLLYLPLLNTSKVTTMFAMCAYCRSLIEFPLLDTTNVTEMQDMCSNCDVLINIPLLNTANVTSMLGTFSNCPNLSDESLNNILQMCTNSKVTENKTLQYVGLSQEQATKCATLSNWQAFLDAGWTSGY